MMWRRISPHTEVWKSSLARDVACTGWWICHRGYYHLRIGYLLLLMVPGFSFCEWKSRTPQIQWKFIIFSFDFVSLALVSTSGKCFIVDISYKYVCFWSNVFLLEITDGKNFIRDCINECAFKEFFWSALKNSVSWYKISNLEPSIGCRLQES